MTIFVSTFLLTVLTFCAVIGLLMAIHVVTNFIKDTFSAACRRVFD